MLSPWADNGSPQDRTPCRHSISFPPPLSLSFLVPVFRFFPFLLHFVSAPLTRAQLLTHVSRTSCRLVIIPSISHPLSTCASSISWKASASLSFAIFGTSSHHSPLHPPLSMNTFFTYRRPLFFASNCVNSGKSSTHFPSHQSLRMHNMFSVPSFPWNTSVPSMIVFSDSRSSHHNNPSPQTLQRHILAPHEALISDEEVLQHGQLYPSPPRPKPHSPARTCPTPRNSCSRHECSSTADSPPLQRSSSARRRAARCTA